MFLLMQVEFLQAHLELHQWLQKLQSVARYIRYNIPLQSVQHIQQDPYYVPPTNVTVPPNLYHFILPVTFNFNGNTNGGVVC